MIIRFICCLLACQISFPLFAQPIPKVVWERTFGGYGTDIARDVVETQSGSIVVVGETASNLFSDKNGLLIILNNKGESIVHELLGKENTSEVLNTVAQTPDGNYALAGFVENKQGRKGWLIKIDMSGKILWQKEYGSTPQHAFNDLVVATNGDLVLTGVSQSSGGEDMWLVRTDANGSLLWERNFGAGKPDVARSVVQTADGGFAIGGYTDSKGQGKTDFWLVKTDGKGALEWDKTYGTGKWEGCYQMTATPEGDFVMVGYNSEDKLNYWVVKANPRGDMIWAKEYGGSDMDEAFAVTPTFDGGLAIAGNTRSHRIGSRFPTLWLLKLDANGVSKYDRAYYGGARTDKATGIIQRANGNYVIIGATGSENVGINEDFWAFEVASGEQATEKRPATLTAQFIRFSDPNANEVLDADEQAFIEILIKNEGDIDAFAIEGNIALDNNLRGLVVANSVSIGNLAKRSTKKVTVPLAGNDRLPTDATQFTFTFHDANGSKIPTVSYRLRTEALPMPKVVIQSHHLEAAGGQLIPGAGVALRLQLANEGKKADQNVKVAFVHPASVVPTGNPTAVVANIAPQASAQVVFDFYVVKDYEFQSVPITCIITKGNGDTLQYRVKVPVDHPKPVVADAPTVIRWYYPDIDFYRDSPFKLNNQKLFVKIKVESPKEYRREDLVVYVNDQPYNAGSKFGEGSLVPSGKNNRNIFTFTYQDSIAFTAEGTYRVTLRDKNDTEIASEALEVAFSKAKPNLFVLAVGTKTNLEYTMQDAKDFADLYRAQKGGLFGSVEVMSLLGTEATATNIMAALDKLSVKFKTDNITPNDMVIVFMSSHGFILGDEFYIQGDDYQTGMHRSKAVRYSLMMEVMDELTCKKLIFIDACHSGGAKGVTSANINEAINALNSIKVGTSTIVSSAADELSYEDKTWENGAFTEGIIRALRNGEADTDANSIITISELYDFLRREVPSMVKSVKERPQTPQLLSKGLGNVGIFAK